MNVPVAVVDDVDQNDVEALSRRGGVNVPVLVYDALENNVVDVLQKRGG